MEPIFVTKTQLAVMYFPNVSKERARHTLMGVIKTDRLLCQQLRDTGYEDGQRFFTPIQVGLIRKRLG